MISLQQGSNIPDLLALSAAQVYKAFRNGVQVVAVKIFTDQVPGENQARYAEAFRREIFILRSCHDRNIVQFLGACLQVGCFVLLCVLYPQLMAGQVVWWVQQHFCLLRLS